MTIRIARRGIIGRRPESNRHSSRPRPRQRVGAAARVRRIRVPGTTMIPTVPIHDNAGATAITPARRPRSVRAHLIRPPTARPPRLRLGIPARTSGRPARRAVGITIRRTTIARPITLPLPAGRYRIAAPRPQETIFPSSPATTVSGMNLPGRCSRLPTPRPHRRNPSRPPLIHRHPPGASLPTVQVPTVTKAAAMGADAGIRKYHSGRSIFLSAALPASALWAPL
jgi:hypothetical protein